ncbi:Slp family lipoprotein [uncultured Thiodictyon sp.]|uniref:Slp family lipoprotein n=1 Tax=uncultured Thiodictyon sp. TaxID=1846217 RepID=UPI0025D384B5|nr:Slp family lipoprotein [uncultured Thiodictyon sp.]
MKSHAAYACFSGALIAALTLPGCATTTDCVGAIGNPSVTPAQVAASQGHAGELQRWGGSVVEGQNLADRTELTIVGYPLDRCGVPRLNDATTGRFVAVVPGYLETGDYRPGRAVTATGLISGTRASQVGASPYQLPLLTNAKVRLWPAADGPGPAPGPGPGPASGSGRWWDRVHPSISVGIGAGSGGWHGGYGGIGIGF